MTLRYALLGAALAVLVALLAYGPVWPEKGLTGGGPAPPPVT